MKKIFIIFCVLIAFGCSKEEVQPKKDIVVKRSVITEAKKYYVAKTTYVNHDDFFEYVNKKNNEALVVQVTNNNEVTEEVDSYENIVVNNEIEEIISEENEIINTAAVNYEENINREEVESNILVKENLEIKEEDKLIMQEESVAIEDISSEKASSNIELENNDDIKEETSNLESSDEVMNEKLEVPSEIKQGYYAPNGMYLGETKVKVIDVSYYQGDINWDVFASKSDCYGVILRLGYYNTLDKKFERNINELKRLNIPYGIYLFSYATTLNGSNKEALFTNKMIDKYELQPTLGIYYDIESWNASNGASSNDITKGEYDIIISNYINKVSTHVGNKYKVKVYSGRWYAMNRLGATSKSYVDWVAEYNSTLKYDSSYTMWQYTSKGSVPGINGNVDISYLY